MPQPNRYDPGQIVVLSTTFSVEGVGTNPSSVTLTVVRPDNTTLTPVPISDGSGVYHADVPTTHIPGEWHYRWVGTGVAAGADDGVFIVRRSRVLGVAP